MRFKVVSKALPDNLANSKVLHVGKNDKDSRTIGMEIELIFQPHVFHTREGLRLLHMEALLNKEPNGAYTYNEYKNLNALKEVATKAIFPMYNNLMYKEIQPDKSIGEDSIEFSYKPFTEKFMAEHWNILMEPVVKAKALQYIDSPQTGIHLWLSYDWLGETTEERIDTLEKLLWFCFLEPGYIHSMTKRHAAASALADFSTLLGDAYGLLEPAALKNLFVEEKKALIRLWNIGKQVCVFNMSFNKEGIPGFEIRWFASSTNPLEIKQFIKDLTDLIAYCKSLPPGHGPLTNLLDLLKYKKLADG